MTFKIRVFRCPNSSAARSRRKARIRGRRSVLDREKHSYAFLVQDTRRNAPFAIWLAFFANFKIGDISFRKWQRDLKHHVALWAFPFAQREAADPNTG